MHRDTKLGLALAILVMGFAAALCFPRESDEPVAHLETQLAREIDTAIRHRPVKPYTDADRPRTKEPPVITIPAETIPGAIVPANDVPSSVDVTTVPDPVPGRQETEPTPVEPEAFPADIVAEPAAEPVVATKTYTVVFGDTLSRIAERELGSSSPRAIDQLFVANRHQLSNPNSLAPGMKLVIPIPDAADEESDLSTRSPVVDNTPPPEPSTVKPSPSSTLPRKRFGGTRVGSGTGPRMN